MVVYGDKALFSKALLNKEEIVKTKSIQLENSKRNNLKQKLMRELKENIAQIVKISPEILDENKELMNYGFDSINFTELSNKLKQIYQLGTITPALFFEHPTISKFSDYLLEHHVNILLKKYEIADLDGEKNQQIEESDLKIISPSCGQEGLYSIYLLNPYSAHYNVGMAVELEGEVVIPLLEKALNIMVNRHDVLRMSFYLNDGNLQAIINQSFSIELKLKTLDKKTSNKINQANAIHHLIQKLHAEPFDLSKGPLLRCYLVSIDKDYHILITLMHHIITDGWSMGLLNKEWMQHYNALLVDPQYKVPSLPINYRDYIRVAAGNFYARSGAGRIGFLEETIGRIS